eukprot:scaffold156269_cov28-Tisochrysis_lutea.AAC.2
MIACTSAAYKKQVARVDRPAQAFPNRVLADNSRIHSRIALGARAKLGCPFPRDCSLKDLSRQPARPAIDEHPIPTAEDIRVTLEDQASHDM